MNPTPQLLALEAAARHDYNVEVDHHYRDVLALMTRQNDAEQRSVTTRQAAADAEATAKGQWATYDQDLDQRLAGEGNLSLTLVRQRRRKELERARSRCFEPEAAARRAVAAVDAELASLAQERIALDERLPSRCQAVEEHYRHQTAVYWRTLVRHHPSGSRLIALGLAPEGRSYARWSHELAAGR